jgi:hypothetical protein
VSWMALGGAAVLQLVSGVVRMRAWFHVIHDASPDASDVRYRDVALAQIGGSGWNAILPARAGDAVKVALVSRRMPKRRLTLLAATLVPPALVEAAITVLLLAGLLANGLMSLKTLTSSLPGTTTVLILVGVVAAVLVAGVVFRRRLHQLLLNIRSGLAVLGHPKAMVKCVVPWVLLGRVVRLLSFALVLVAAGVPFGIVPALALMALQGATPSAGAAATALRITLLAGILSHTGASGVPATRIAEALAASYGVTSAVNLVASAAVIAWTLRTVSPRRIFRYARSSMQNLKRERKTGDRPWKRSRPAEATSAPELAATSTPEAPAVSHAPAASARP